jgi:hypothetical protein
MFNVYMKLTDGEKVTWVGEANNSGHAMAQAFKYVNENYEATVYDFDMEEEGVHEEDCPAIDGFGCCGEDQMNKPNRPSIPRYARHLMVTCAKTLQGMR